MIPFFAVEKQIKNECTRSFFSGPKRRGSTMDRRNAPGKVDLIGQRLFKSFLWPKYSGCICFFHEFEWLSPVSRYIMFPFGGLFEKSSPSQASPSDAVSRKVWPRKDTWELVEAALDRTEEASTPFSSEVVGHYRHVYAAVCCVVFCGVLHMWYGVEWCNVFCWRVVVHGWVLLLWL